MKVKILAVLLIVALVINVGELFLVNDFIMSTPGGWGDIPGAGIPWILSLLLLFSAIVIQLLEEYKR